MPHLPLMQIGSSQPWNPTLPRYVTSTHPKNTGSASFYTACSTPVDYSTSTHYKAALLTEGYSMSAFDNCPFYRTTATKTTYIIVYIDDTFIFSNSAANFDTVITSIGNHYEVTLDRDATSFLGLHHNHNADGTVTITQPKLLLKLFALYPPLKDHAHKPTHPYPPLSKDLDPTP